jgi:hypothetical protein
MCLCVNRPCLLRGTPPSGGAADRRIRRPDGNLPLLLTTADTHGKVRPEELEEALRITTALAWDALTAPDATVKELAT